MTGFKAVVAAELEAAGKLLVQDGNHGEYRPRPSEFSDVGTAFIRASDMANGHLLFDKAGRINETALRRIRKGIGRPQDVILSHKGTVGKVAFAGADCEPFVCSPQTTFWRSLDHEVIDPKYLFFAIRSPGFTSQLRTIENETDMAAYVPLTQQRRLSLSVPPIAEQRKIVSILGVMDDKIAVNDRIARASRDLCVALYHAACAESSAEACLEELAILLTRGQAPKYTEEPTGITVLNQKCVRDGRILLDPARRTEARRVKSDRILQKYDVLVNSTGVGTLGRVGLWSQETPVTVDSHVTIVRTGTKVPAIVSGFALLAAQPEIEAMGEGSTGQTELSRAKLTSLKVRIPEGETGQLADRLSVLEERSNAALHESHALAELRDILLPELMSGRLRVRDAEKVAEEAV
ncbi:restriction endonuclease subunit S [Micromonospora aurantiaca (nom. illeg.)]|uniref:restriction endonuclease subunit S n=1 Tax=Micromonospora aurantiaca (nom. illeg.) TaxID=47850 RepID=UPI0035B4A7C9